MIGRQRYGRSGGVMIGRQRYMSVRRSYDQSQRYMLVISVFIKNVAPQTH